MYNVAEIVASSRGTRVEHPRLWSPWWAMTAAMGRTGSDEDELLAEAGAAICAATLLARPLRAGDDEMPDREVIEAQVELTTDLIVALYSANGIALARSACMSVVRDVDESLSDASRDLRGLGRDVPRALSRLQQSPVEAVAFSPDPPDVAAPERPRAYLASPLTGFEDVSPEWLWARGVHHAPISDPGRPETWRAASEARGRLALEWQRTMNASVAAALRAIGLDVYVPHENFDPDHHKDKDPKAVDEGDRVAVALSDCIVFVADYPATGAGKELVLAENGLESTFVVSSITARISRLILGTTHSVLWVPADPSNWARVAVEGVTADLPRHAHHARVRRLNGEAWGQVMETWPDSPQDTEGLLSLDRALQLRRNPELVSSASFQEVDQLFRLFGRQLALTDTPPLEGTASRPPAGRRSIDPASDEVQHLADHHLRASVGLSTSTPNSAEMLRRSVGVGPAVEDPTLQALGETRRGPDGLRITVRRSDNRRRTNFTIAHEVAHILLEGDALTVSHRKGADPDHALEAAANQLAACLLLPQEWFEKQRAALARSGTRPDSLAELNALSAAADVTLDVVSLRLGVGSPMQPKILVTARLGPVRWDGRLRAGAPSEWVRAGLRFDLSAIPRDAPMAPDEPTYLVRASIDSRRLRCVASVSRTSRDVATVLISDFVEDGPRPR